MKVTSFSIARKIKLHSISCIT